jgi:uncharacterized lipoprotein YmbA
MNMFRTSIIILLLFLAASVLSGCSRSPRVAFYTLNSVTGPEPAAVSGSPYSLVIGPATIPDLYDRPQLVLRLDTNRVEILESHRWASPLKSEIPRIIAEDLTIMLAPARVTTYPQSGGQEADFRVLLDVQRFDMTPGKGIDFETLWSISRSGELLKRRKTSVHEPVNSFGNDALVAAYDRALATVSRDIAAYLSIEKPSVHK